MNLALGFSRQFRRLGILMSIPVTILISMLVIRFINQSGPGRTSAPGALLPTNKIELETGQHASISELTGELEQKQQQARSNHKLISLDFPQTSPVAKKPGGYDDPDFDHEANNLHGGNAEQETGSQKQAYQGATNQSADNSLMRLEKVNTGKHVQHRSEELYASARTREKIENHMAGLPVTADQLRGLSPMQGSDHKAGQSSNGLPPGFNGLPPGFNGYSKEDHTTGTGFSSDMSDTHPGQKEKSGIQVHAVALGDQRVHQGSVVKFRTMSGYIIDGHSIAQNTIFYAFASFENDRLKLYVNKLKAGATAIKIHLACFDDDDKEGIAMHIGHSKWAETAEAGKNSAVDEVSSRLPVGSGILSQVGHKLFSGSRNDEFALTDGSEFSFIQVTD